jgi:beta-lactamase regulating signal transducer with metallopeptidase domain
MMTNEVANAILSGLIRANLAGGAAVLGVLALRLPARRLFGPETAYLLWGAVPMAAAASLLPARVVMDAVEAPGLPAAIASHAHHLLAVWMLGVGVAVALLVRAQRAFERGTKAGRGGPAVVGVLSPRVIMPPDDGRYTTDERALIRAHERAHIERRDPRAGALAAALQALAWFNPLAHWGSQLMRLDQELACDAAVLRRRPRDRALYARTLLKTQLAARPLPFGCYWPARGAHPLEVRVGLLKASRPRDDLVGAPLVCALVVSAGAVAWAAQPPIPPYYVPTIAVESPAMSVLILRAVPGKVPVGS